MRDIYDAHTLRADNKTSPAPFIWTMKALGRECVVVNPVCRWCDGTTMACRGWTNWWQVVHPVIVALCILNPSFDGRTLLDFSWISPT